MLTSSYLNAPVEAKIMAKDNQEISDIDDVESPDTLETLDHLEAIDRVDESEARKVPDDNDDDILIVHDSELIEPLEAADVVDLDYDEDMPTRADGRRSQERRETYPPAREDAKDIYYLTEERRPSPGIAGEERVRIADVLQPPRLPKVVPPPRRDAIFPAAARQSEISSIAPMALPHEREHEAQPVRRRWGSAAYGSIVAGLAAVAAVLALWPTGSASDDAASSRVQSMPANAAAAVVKASETKLYAAQPMVHRLDVVEIFTDEPRTKGATENAAPSPREAQLRVPVAPPADPGGEVVIDDAAQLTGDIVFPTGESATAGADGPSEALGAQVEEEEERLEAPAPPQDARLPFDRAAASAALSAASGLASGCRSEGMPELTARVSVTFAPSGRVTTAVVHGPGLAGTAAGGCIARKFRTIRVEPFQGPPVTVHKSFQF